MANKLVLGLLLLTALAVAGASAASVTVYNPATFAVNVALGVGVDPRDGADDDDNVVNVSTMISTVNLNSDEQDIHFETDEGHQMDVHVHDGDVLVLIPDSDGDGGLAFKVLLHQASLRVIVFPPPTK